MKWICKFVSFLFWCPVAFLYIFLELLNNVTELALGFQNPRMNSVAIFRHYWKDLLSVKPIKVEIDGIDGYMYWKRTYSDGTQLFFID